MKASQSPEDRSERSEAGPGFPEKTAAILFLCHSTGNELLEEYRKIRTATQDTATTFILFHQNNRQPPPEWGTERIFCFSEESLATLPYPPIRNTIVPGSAHYAVLDFFKQHPGYEYYWVIEYDVRFSGDWKFFFDAFRPRKEDFLSSHIRRYSDEPRWYWWRCLAHPHKRILFPDRLRSFNPIFRISNTALMHLDLAQREEWWGHYEVLIPTLLCQGGLRIADFGGVGEFVVPGDENKYYLDSAQERSGRLKEGTLRWRPAFAGAGPLQNKLYHPVKPTLL